MTWTRKFLEPGETVLFRQKGQPLALSVLYSGLLSAGLVVLMGLALEEFEFAGLDLRRALALLAIFVFWTLLFGFVNCGEAVLATDRRVIRRDAFNHKRIEAIDRADIAEVRQKGDNFILVARPGAEVRRLAPGGGFAGTGKTALGVSLRNGGPSYKTRGEAREAVARMFGHAPLYWRNPALPDAVEWLITGGWISLAVLPLAWLAGVWAVLALAVGAARLDIILLDPVTLWLAPLLLAGLWPVVAGRRYLLLAAAALLPAETARLYLCATRHPDWLGEHPGTTPDGTNRAGRIAAAERFLSRLTGHPIRCEDAPGPEEFGGGWRG